MDSPREHEPVRSRHEAPIDELQNDDEGHRLRRLADQWMAAQHIKNPRCITRMLAPGFPDAMESGPRHRGERSTESKKRTPAVSCRSRFSVLACARQELARPAVKPVLVMESAENRLRRNATARRNVMANESCRDGG
jgi:hypothetical protein